MKYTSYCIAGKVVMELKLAVDFNTAKVSIFQTIACSQILIPKKEISVYITKYSNQQPFGCIVNRVLLYIHIHLTSLSPCSPRNNSWPLAIFRPISTFGRPKSILVSQIYCTFSMGRPSITYKMSHLQKNSRPISDSYFYHCLE